MAEAPSGDLADGGRRVRRHTTLALFLLAMLLALSVYGLNRAPLFYFDTASYLDQGYKILASLGYEPPVAEAATGGAGTKPGQPGDGIVDSSRSAAYGVALATVDAFASLDTVVFLNLALITLALWLVARRLGGPAGPSPWLLTAVGIAAASLTALPFYVAFLMPDILAPVLILMLAFLCSYALDLDRREFAVALALAIAAVLAHPSHLLTAALFLPVGIMLSPVLRGRRVIVAVVLLVGIVAVGALERLAFSAAVERLQNRQAQALPFLTARLINDGPGLDYLAAHCPDPELATCALAEALEQSQDPWRLHAPNILFSQDPQLGSFKLLSAEEQSAISAEQFEFVADVVRSRPASVMAAVARNALTQLVFVRIDMTVPSKARLAHLQASYGPPVANLRNGWLIEQPRVWPGILVYWHGAVYLISAGLLIALLFSRHLSSSARTFAGLILVGILANAVVCGGISVPAHRYGARVALLVPMVAAVLGSIHLHAARRAAKDPVRTP